jgi:hypothetical protein
MTIRRFALYFAFAALLMPSPGSAADTKAATKLLGTYGGWKAYVYGDKNDQVCYMTLATHFPPNKKMKRETSFLMITHRPAENSKNVVSYVAGYNFKATSEVKVDIGKKSYDLFTQKDTAWSRDASTDHAVALAIRDGSGVKITGTPAAKGATPVTDTLNLKGAAAAYQAIGKACGYPADTPPKASKPATPAKKPKVKTSTH